MSFASPDELTVSDPVAMRALAHPTRVALLDHLAVAGPSTATEAAEAVGGSAASCSYHLRTLAKHGFVAEVTSSDGRERPWRRVGRAVRVTIGTEERSGRSLLDTRLARDEEILADYLTREADEPEEWREAALMISTAATLTADELAGMGKQIAAMVSRDRGAADRSGRRRVHLAFRAIPLPESA